MWLRVVKEASTQGDHVVERLLEHAARQYDRKTLRQLLAVKGVSPAVSPDSSSSTATAVVIGALSLEVQALLVQLEEVSEEVHPSQETLAYVGHLRGRHARWRVGVLLSQQTSADAAVITERAISWFRPDVAFFVGVAGGIKDVRAGDVVASDSVYEVEYGKDTVDGYEVRPREFRGAHGLVQRATFTAATSEWQQRIHRPECAPAVPDTPNVHIEPIACGMKVVQATKGEIYERIRKAAPRAVAIEMEGTGFSTAVDKALGVRGLVVRGVSDMLKDKGDPFDLCRQRVAAAHAAAFAGQMLHDMQLRD